MNCAKSCWLSSAPDLVMTLSSCSITDTTCCAVVHCKCVILSCKLCLYSDYCQNPAAQLELRGNMGTVTFLIQLYHTSLIWSGKIRATKCTTLLLLYYRITLIWKCMKHFLFCFLSICCFPFFFIIKGIDLSSLIALKTYLHSSPKDKAPDWYSQVLFCCKKSSSLLKPELYCD